MKTKPRLRSLDDWHKVYPIDLHTVLEMMDGSEPRLQQLAKITTPSALSPFEPTSAWADEVKLMIRLKILADQLIAKTR